MSTETKQKEVVCINQKRYNITNGNIYAVIKEDDSYYWIRNNNDIASKYHKELFEEKSLETPESVLESFNPNTKTFIYNKRNFTLSSEFQFSESDISCGVYQIRGLNGVIRNIENLIHENCVDFSREDNNILTEKIFEKFLHYKCNAFYEEEAEYAFLLASTNVSANSKYTSINKILTKYSNCESDQVNNPNSENTIKVWILDYTKF